MQQLALPWDSRPVAYTNSRAGVRFKKTIHPSDAANRAALGTIEHERPLRCGAPRLRVLAALAVASASYLAASPCVAEPMTPEPPEQPSMWRSEWPTFSWLEGALTVAGGVGTVVLVGLKPDHARTQGGVLFDDSVRRALRSDSAEGRQTMRTIGDWSYHTSPLLPLVIDPIAVAWLGRGDAKAGLNVGLVGLEGFSYSGFLTFASLRSVARERPDSSECRRQGGKSCVVDNESFWSGHAAISATAAGLTCANHHYMRLWGRPWADATACALSAAGALTTGLTRVMGDRHYTTDVLTGLSLGFAVGYAVPTLLHYTRTMRVTVSVDTSGDCQGGGCLGVRGVF